MNQTLHNLPSTLTSFIGREQETADIHNWLAQTRLVTLTGVGGVGKTRLVLQVARQSIENYADGVWWVDLSVVSDPELLLKAVAAVVNVQEVQERPLFDTLLQSLSSKHLLLVLDNCEHLIAAVAHLAEQLLRTCSRLLILATSRERLNLSGEQVFAVPPLSLPETIQPLAPETLIHYGAIHLFEERARAVWPEFKVTAHNATAVTEICRRLDGIPLAIELAAARVKMLTPAQIAARLNETFRLLTRGTADMPLRHQTLWAAMEWSYQFLATAEQVLLNRLSVFAGSFTLDMVETICGKGLENVLDLLTALADKSFVLLLPRPNQDEARYGLLETIRQYAREKLESSGETAVFRTNLLEWCASFVTQNESKLAGPEAATWLARLEVDHDNIRAALRWVRTNRNVVTGLSLVGALWLFWLNRGHLTEGRSWLEELLTLGNSLPTAQIPPPIRAKALYAAAVLAFRQGDYTRATTLVEASVYILRELQDKARMGTPLNLLAILATERGDLVQAAAIHGEAITLYRSLGDLVRVSSVLINLGIVARQQGAYRRAASLYKEALTLKRQFGDTFNVALVLNNLGEIALAQGEYAHAIVLLQESLMLYRDLGGQNGIGLALNNLGAVARCQQEHEQAKTFLDESLSIYQQTGDQNRAAIVQLNLGDLARDEGDWMRAQNIYANCLAHFQESHDRANRALALYSLGLVAAHHQDIPQAMTHLTESLKLYQALTFPLGITEVLEGMAGLSGKPKQATRWLGTADFCRQQMGIPIPPVDQGRYKQTVSHLQTMLGQEAFQAAWAQGQATPLEQAVAEALAENSQPEPMVKTAEPLIQIFALGSTRVIVEGRTLTAPDWTYHKSKELLFYLLSHPPCTKAQIGLDLWSEASAEQLRNIFHRAVYYLRQALDHGEWLLFAAGAYTFNPAVPLWYDVRIFEAQLQEAEKADGREEKIGKLETAVSLWHGDFLEEMDAGEWVIFQREALRRLFLKALTNLGGLYFAEAHYGKAAEIYQRLLAQDNYLELAHRELMRCYARQGESGQAIRHFQQLHQLLHNELQAEPSPETRLLYERLKRGDDI